VLTLLLALTVYVTGRSWLGRSAALGGAVLVLGTAAMVDKGRLAEIEAAYVALTGLAAAVWLEGWARGRLTAARWAAAGLLLGLGLLAKGPLHLAFFAGLAALCLGRDGLARELRRPGPWLAALLTLAPLAGWLAAIHDHRAAAAQVWWSEMDRVEQTAGGARLFRETVGDSLGSVLNLMPAALLALPLLRREHRERLPPAVRRFVWAAGWLGLVAVVLLPAIPGYRPRYSMPAYGPLLTALALGGEALLAGARGRTGWRRVVTGIAALALTAGLAGAAAGPAEARGLAALGALAGAVLLFWNRRPMPDAPAAWRRWAAALAALALAAFAWARPQFVRQDRLRAAAARVAPFVPADGKLLVMRPGFVKYLFYLHGRYAFVLEPEDLPAGEAIVYTTAARAETLGARTGRPVAVLHEERLHRTGEGQVIRVVRLGPRPRRSGRAAGRGLRPGGTRRDSQFPRGRRGA
jgi:4-amino-4-deoxy-L-arabinose transferase-like glycosyltransferase